jgi:uncharacterized protein (DUF924 family)
MESPVYRSPDPVLKNSNVSHDRVKTMYRSLIDFWFSDEARRYWFKSTRAFDKQLVDSYADTWEQARKGALDDWQRTAVGSLALVIVLDQFPLNMFRGTAKSFSTEALSRTVVRAAIAKNFDKELPTNQKSFMYMPFMHSEDLADQALGVEYFNQSGLESNFRYAKHHFGIVERFGRFPHRNKILGRESSEAEIKYLNSKQGFKG